MIYLNKRNIRSTDTTKEGRKSRKENAYFEIHFMSATNVVFEYHTYFVEKDRAERHILN